MSLKPLGDRVVIEALAQKEEKIGNIYIPDTAKEKPSEGVIVAVGPGIGDAKMQVKVGDQVLYAKFSGTEIKQNEKEFLIIQESDILAIIG